MDTILLGSYTDKIHTLYFTKPSSPSAKDGKLIVGPSSKVGTSPSWVAQHPVHKDIIYSVLEDEKDGKVFVGRLIDGGKGGIKEEGVVSSGGGAPVSSSFFFLLLLASTRTFLRNLRWWEWSVDKALVGTGKETLSSAREAVFTSSKKRKEVEGPVMLRSSGH